MNALIENIGIKNLYFKDQVFGNQFFKSEIKNLEKYMRENLKSDSPFILLTAYNHVKTIIAFYAILKLGKVAVIINPELRSIELTEVIEETDPAAIILMNASGIHFNYEEELLFRTASSNFIVHSNLDDVVILMYSNAEEGKAKAAMITQHNILSALHTFIRVEGITEKNSICALLPYHHLFGLTYGLILPFYIGCNALISDLNLLRFNDLVKSLKKAAVTNIFSIPTFYYLLSRAPGIKDAFKNTNDFISGGIKLSPKIYETFLKATGKKLREGYGLTESAPGVTLTPHNEFTDLDSIGQVLPNCEIKIFNDKGNECIGLETGEIYIKGDIVFKGYFNNQQATEKNLKDGWLHTGDLGTKNDKGYIQYKGLKKQMYNVAGNNVFPNELERLMKMYKDVKDVQIYKENSELQGDIVCAQVELGRPSEKNIENFKKWCVKNITNYKLPKVWEFVK